MELFKIFPHHGYLNTDFILKSCSETNLSSMKIDGKDIHISAVKEHTLKLSAGKHTIIFKSGIDEQEEFVIVEDAYRFGGSKLKYAYLTPHSPHAVLVMLDRMYIYNYETDECWYENKLTPDSVEEVYPNILMFKTETFREIDGKQNKIIFHSLFDIRTKSILENFEEKICLKDDYIVYRNQIDCNTLTIYNLKYNFSWKIEVDAYCVDEENNCLYYTKSDDNKAIYAFSQLSKFFYAYLNIDDGKAVIDIGQLNEDTVRFEQIVYELKWEYLIQFEGGHYAVTNSKVIDLKNNCTMPLKSSWGTLTQVNGNNIEDIEDRLALCTQGEGINSMLKDNYQFCEGIVKRYSTIKTYSLDSGILWVEECWEAKANAYRVPKDCVYKILHASNIIKTHYGEMATLVLPSNARFSAINEDFLSIAVGDTTLNVKGDGNVLESYEETAENEEPYNQNRTAPGIKQAQSLVEYIDINGNQVSQDVIIYQNGRSIYVGLWSEDLSQYIQEGKLSEAIDNSSFSDALFSAEDNGVLIKDGNQKRFMWMKPDGTLKEYSFDDDTYIMKGINGYKPLIKFDKYRRPIFVDPVTSAHITPPYLANYVFTNPDKTLYADNNHLKHIRYKDITTDTYISQDDFRELKKKLEYPEDCRCDLGERKEKYKDIYDERLRRINELGLENIINADLLRQMPTLKDKTSDQQADFLASFNYFSVIDFYAREEQWIIIKDSNHNIFKEFCIGKPLWFLNYVSFSYDNKYVAVSGRYPDGSGLGGLLYVYNLFENKCVFDSTLESDSYNAVWIAAFNKQGEIGSYSSGSIRNGAITRFYDFKDGRYQEIAMLNNRNFLTYSGNGNLIAMSDQNYIRTGYEAFGQDWGHQPSCNVYVRNKINGQEIGPFNDFGTDKYEGGIIGVSQRKESIASVSFSPDEQRYLAVSKDGVVVIRNIPTASAKLQDEFGLNVK